jgi:phosphotransferase system enzyme I (PtsI)
MSPDPETLVLRGVPAAPGLVLGRAHLVDRRRTAVPHRRVPRGEAEAEIARLRGAVEACRQELGAIRERVGDEAGETFLAILDAHILMLGDPTLLDAAEREITDGGANAEWAVRSAVDALVARLGASPDRYLRERAGDVEQVGERLLARLVGRRTLPPAPLAGRVVVARDLDPGDAAQLARAEVEALVLELGSATSHTAILARTLGIPAVVGVPEATARIAAGDEVFVDALRGEVVVAPNPEARERAEDRARRYRLYTGRIRAKHAQPCRTRDGADVELTANVELPAEAALTGHEGAAGIGLFRTEYLFIERGAALDEEAQTAVYADVARVMAPRPVTFRTFDLGADKVAPETAGLRGPNPALGLRGLRLAFLRADLLLPQVRAILRAAAHGEVRLMFPMVTGLADFRVARALVDRAAQSLAAEGLPYRRVPVGAMIEVPSAVVTADLLAREAEFFSIGTNDLAQYALALDRGDPRLQPLARPWEPALLRMIRATVRAACAAPIPVAVCGDMACDPLALPLLVGLGVRSLGAPLPQLALVREIVGCLDSREAAEVAEAACECPTAADVERLVRARFGDALREVWEEQGIAPALDPPA